MSSRAPRRPRGRARGTWRPYLLVGEPGIGKSRLAEELAHTRGHAEPRSSSAAAGRPAARPPTGPGFSLFAPTFATPTRGAASAARRRRGRSRPASARVARAVPRPPRNQRRWSQRMRAFACSTPRPASCKRAALRARSSSSSTTCTPPMLPRFSCFGFCPRAFRQPPARDRRLSGRRSHDSGAAGPDARGACSEPATHQISLAGLSDTDVADSSSSRRVRRRPRSWPRRSAHETEGNPLFVTEVSGSWTPRIGSATPPG